HALPFLSRWTPLQRWPVRPSSAECTRPPQSISSAISPAVHFIGLPRLTRPGWDILVMFPVTLDHALEEQHLPSDHVPTKSEERPLQDRGADGLFSAEDGHAGV